jgi:hypothetical protein
MKEATSWPDAGIAIAGIGFVTAVSLALIWQIFATLRDHLALNASRERQTGDMQGERA